MKGVDRGELYNEFKDKEFDTDKLEKKVAKLMQDDDVERKSGIYPYVLDGDERHLNIRAFSDNMKREAYERQKGVCIKCKKKFQLDEMEGDHIKPWHEGGKATQRIARCCANTTIEGNQGDSYQIKDMVIRDAESLCTEEAAQNALA